MSNQKNCATASRSLVTFLCEPSSTAQGEPPIQFVPTSSAVLPSNVTCMYLRELLIQLPATQRIFDSQLPLAALLFLDINCQANLQKYQPLTFRGLVDGVTKSTLPGENTQGFPLYLKPSPVGQSNINVPIQCVKQYNSGDYPMFHQTSTYHRQLKEMPASFQVGLKDSDGNSVEFEKLYITFEVESADYTVQPVWTAADKREIAMYMRGTG